MKTDQCELGIKGLCKVVSLHLQRAKQSKDNLFKSMTHTRCVKWVVKETTLCLKVFFLLLVEKPI